MTRTTAEEIVVPAGIHRKVADVMGEIENIKKRGSFKVNNEERYKFVQATDMYEAIRAKFAERGISFLASFVDIISERQDGKLNVVTVQVSLTLTDADTGGTFSALWAGSGQDYGDKAIPKAFTGAVKSWLMTTFLVPSDTDPDDSGGTARTPRQSSTKKQTAADRKNMAALLKAYVRVDTDAQQVKLKLIRLGSKGQDVNAETSALSQDKAVALMQWLDGELVKRQGGPDA